MGTINIEDATIDFEGEWLSLEDLTQKIRQKLEVGDLKFAKLAAALEELKTALEKSHVLETKIVLSQANYERLKELAGGDSRAGVHKAVMAFIKRGAKTGLTGQLPAKRSLNCTQCNSPIDVGSDEIPEELECPECGSRERLQPQKKSDIRHQDHFLG